MPKKMFAWVAAAVAAATLLLLSWIRSAAADPSPAFNANLTAQAAVLIDADTGQVLVSKNAEKREEPASTTKILTALVALQHGNLQDVVTVSKNDWGLEGSSAYLEAGEQQTLENMLYALMLPSGNDAAAAIAEHIGGSIAGFAQMMNATAVAVGATGSHFVNPHGLPDRNHYTTPLDLARITRVAMQNPEFARIVATKSFELPGGHQERLFYNHNKLLWRYEGATGVKTGYTDAAGHTLVASAQRGDRRLIAVLMDDQREASWTDAEKLLDYGFSLSDPTPVVQPQQAVANLPVNAGSQKTVPVVATQELKLFLAPGEVQRLERRVDLPSVLSAPVTAGQKVGRMDFVENGKVLGTVDLAVGTDVPVQAVSIWRRASGGARRAAAAALHLLLWAGGGLLALFVLLVILARFRGRGGRRRLRRTRSRSSGDYLPLHRVIRRNFGD